MFTFNLEVSVIFTNRKPFFSFFLCLHPFVYVITFQFVYIFICLFRFCFSKTITGNIYKSKTLFFSLFTFVCLPFVYIVTLYFVYISNCLFFSSFLKTITGKSELFREMCACAAPHPRHRQRRYETEEKLRPVSRC